MNKVPNIWYYKWTLDQAGGADHTTATLVIVGIVFLFISGLWAKERYDKWRHDRKERTRGQG